MAGIGFVLRKLSRQDNLLGLFRAYFHSALASTGPWLFTVFSLGSMVYLSGQMTSKAEIYEFRLVIIYNFAFSLVFSAPVFMIATRYLADMIHNKDVSLAPGMFVGALVIMYATQMPLVVWFYFSVADFSDGLAFSAIVNFMLVSGIWLVAVFLTALKDFRTVTWSFGVGLLVSLIGAPLLAGNYGSAGLLNGFSAGLSVVCATIIARIFAEYPYRVQKIFAILPYFRKYWELALSGFFYNAAAWVDKWVMWFAPEAEKHPSNLLLYPNYDAAMFLAYLTIVPSMAMFVFSVETNFFEHYVKFYRDIQQGATFHKIHENHKSIIRSMFSSARNFLILQGSICATVIILSPMIFQMMNVNYMQLGIFRYGVLGALFHVMTLFLCIMLSYFDNRIAVLRLNMLFFVFNLAFTALSITLGFEYYGVGYFLASLCLFGVAAFKTAIYVNELPFHTFITSNQSVSFVDNEDQESDEKSHKSKEPKTKESQVRN